VKRQLTQSENELDLDQVPQDHALARRRLNALFAMMKNHGFYRDPQICQEIAAA
jgi:hypothetical protein